MCFYEAEKMYKVSFCYDCPWHMAAHEWDHGMNSQLVAIAISSSFLQTSGTHPGGSGYPPGFLIKTRDPWIIIIMLGPRLHMCKIINRRNGTKKQIPPDRCLADTQRHWYTTSIMALSMGTTPPLLDVVIMELPSSVPSPEFPPFLVGKTTTVRGSGLPILERYCFHCSPQSGTHNQHIH